jgi:hypothetical protein
MKKWIAMLAVSTMYSIGAVAQVVIIDEWDMNGNGTWQNSNNGLSLGNHYSSNNQQVAQIADDGTFIFSPSTLGQNFGGKTSFSSSVDLTEGVVTLSWTCTAMDWSATSSDNNQVGIRLWDAAENNYVGLAFTDNSDRIFAYSKSSAALGNINQKTGRVINGLVDSSTPRTVSLEIDYANSEIRVSADAWQWNNGFNVHTTAVDFASAGMTNIAKFQTYYQSWGTGDQTIFDNLSLSQFVPLEGTYIADQGGSAYPQLSTNTVAPFSAEAGDMLVVALSSNKGDLTADTVEITGSAILEPITFSKESGTGPGSYLWHGEVLSTGTVVVKYSSGTSSFGTCGAYLLRSSTGGVRLLDLDSVDGEGVPGETVLGLTNNYAFGSSVSGVYIEAESSYNTNPGNKSGTVTLSTVIDYSNGSSSSRHVASGSFSGISSLETVWTNSVANKGALIGAAFGPGVAPSGVNIVDHDSSTFPNVVTNAGMSSFSVLAGDFVAVTMAANNGTVSTNDVVFGGTASFGDLTYQKKSQGPTSYTWHREVLTDGTADLSVMSRTFSVVGTYQLRANAGFALAVLDTARSGGTNTVQSITNSYSFSEVSSGLYLEAFSTYTNAWGTLNENTVLDLANNGRGIGHGEFADLSALDNVWTNGGRNSAVAGVVFGMVDIPTGPTNPTEFWEEWLSGFSLGAGTNMLDDADGDMLQNLAEYAFDGDPSDGADQGNTPVQSLVEDGGSNYLEYVYFMRNDAAARGLDYYIETDIDLILVPGWTNANYEVVGTNTSTGIAGFDAVTNRISTDVEDNQFIRVQVEFSP